MTNTMFEAIINSQITKCKNVLVDKANEYATSDRLHNFRCAAAMQCCSAKEALAGMMAKHTISIYDMCRSGNRYSEEMWSEKITDHINYLLLLRALVTEDNLMWDDGDLDFNLDPPKASNPNDTLEMERILDSVHTEYYASEYNMCKGE